MEILSKLHLLKLGFALLTQKASEARQLRRFESVCNLRRHSVERGVHERMLRTCRAPGFMDFGVVRAGDPQNRDVIFERLQADKTDLLRIQIANKVP